MTPNRKPAKSTPSPLTLRERVLRNCLSEVREKRSSMVQQYRAQAKENQHEMMASFVTEMYLLTKRDSQASLTPQEGRMELDQHEDEDLQSLEHQELLRQIADAVAYELEKQQYMLDEEELLNITESEDISFAEWFDPDDNTIICPLCRNGTMYISEQAGTASCSCGALINLHIHQSSSRVNSTHNSTQNSQEVCADDSRDVSFDRENTVLSAAELKRRLGDLYDRHKIACQQYVLQSIDSSTCANICFDAFVGNGANHFELEYQIFGGHLCGYCTECSFYEQIT